MSTILPVKKLLRRASGLFSGQLFFCALGGICLYLILRHSDTAVSYMSRGLVLCVRTVIPSLFPFMVLSELTVASGCGQLLGHLCEKPMRRMFGISGAGACALIMGLICGFPIGTKTAISLCRHGQITQEECARLICFCNIPSSAFLINAVGVSLFGSRRFGLILYALCVLSSLFIAFLLNQIRPLSPQKEPSTISLRAAGISAFTHAVTSSATAMLYVCAYIVFFTALVGTLNQLLTGLGAGQGVAAALFGFFELSGGVMQAAQIADPNLSRLMAAFMCGWSGLSVHLQIISLCDDQSDGTLLNTTSYLGCKLFQGVICALLCGAVLVFLPSSRLSPLLPISPPALAPVSTQKIIVICNALLFLGCLNTFSRRFRKRRTAPSHKH